MPLSPIPEMMARARSQRYAVGYFESWDFASLQGVVDAAEQSRAPIILGFNGEFLSRPDRRATERLDWYGALGRAAAESAAVPCGLIFNECSRDDWVRRAAEVGFNMVMPADDQATYEDYKRRVTDIVGHAHKHGVAVEAEIGELPHGNSGLVEDGSPTDPDLAAAFVAETGIDLLAVSVGNVHVLLDGQQDLDLQRLAAISRKVTVPLDLHGGTGITADSLRGAIEMGVTKVAFGTYMKQRYLATIRGALDCTDSNPHHLLAYGGDEDIMVAVRLAVRDAVLERIELLGCCGKA